MKIKDLTSYTLFLTSPDTYGAKIHWIKKEKTGEEIRETLYKWDVCLAYYWPSLPYCLQSTSSSDLWVQTMNLVYEPCWYITLNLCLSRGPRKNFPNSIPGGPCLGGFFSWFVFLLCSSLNKNGTCFVLQNSM